jgi:extradiol dioxygenase family protein
VAGVLARNPARSIPGSAADGAAGEQWMTFYYEPAGKPVEFKALADESQLFGH